MKKIKSAILWVVLGGSLLSLQPTFGQGTAFTYQGRLNDGTNPATGNYDLQFTIYDSGSGGSVVAGSLTNAPTGVTNGLFSVTLDFGAGVFTGPARWLELGVRTNGSVGAYTTLVPRQALLPTPYAINAGSLGGELSTAFAPAAGSPTYVAKAGDTMTGTLNLPADGLTLGGSQLIAAGGNVGIGTPGPNAQLSVFNQTSGARVGRFVQNNSGTAGIGALQAVTAQTTGSALDVGHWGGGSDDWAFRAFANVQRGENANVSDPGSIFLFGVRADGNVGIGTPSPGTTLDVQNTNADVYIRAKATGTSGAAGLVLDRASASISAAELSFLTDGSSDFAMGTSQGSAGLSDFSIYDYGIGNNVFTIVKSSGNVGIGTTTPQFALEVGNADRNNGLAVTGPSAPGLTIKNTSGGGHDWEIFSTALTGSQLVSGLGIYDNSQGAYRMAFDANGNVGIGTAFPTNKLDVIGSGI